MFNNEKKLFQFTSYSFSLSHQVYNLEVVNAYVLIPRSECFTNFLFFNYGKNSAKLWRIG
jgi:hypothetical protein